MKIKIFLILLLVTVSAGNVFCQKKNKKITISGYVTDSRHYPVSDAIILIDDVKTDYATDEQGYYKIKVINSANKIGIFSFSTGLTEDLINGRTRINFNLTTEVPANVSDKEDPAENEEIQVGYGTVKRKNLTTPVNKIDGTKKRFASYTSIYDMIQGEVPGVQVRGKSIRIQGVNSLELSNEPLFVVDGIQVSTIDDIHPQVVKSIEILKGASAAIYGSRGSNGVILITTKGRLE